MLVEYLIKVDSPLLIDCNILLNTVHIHEQLVVLYSHFLHEVSDVMNSLPDGPLLIIKVDIDNELYLAIPIIFIGHIESDGFRLRAIGDVAICILFVNLLIT
jgi:hypothetical protein